MRILVAVDGSSDATEAIEWLTHFPLPDDAAIDVVSVTPRPTLDDTVVWRGWDELKAESAVIVEDARKRLAKRWPSATGRTLDGDARHGILDAATRSRTDLVVLGARGLSAVESFLIGSVSLGVARHARCSVLVCKGRARPIRTATLGLDGSLHAKSALRFFSSLPLPSDLRVRLVGVVEPLRYPTTAPEMLSGSLRAAWNEYHDDRRRSLQAVLDTAAREIGARIGEIGAATPTGAPAEMILKDAAQHASDLIVVGARGLGVLKRIALGSVSESVLRHATCPVLIIRRRARA
jgi:nucleotide-binding universal stress UspA family protein